MNAQATCCPPFDPAPWDDKQITWEDKKFVTDRVLCLFHIPLNFGGVMKRLVGKIEAADAKCEDMIALADAPSPWRSNLFVEVSTDVPDAHMTTLSGTFLTKVFEGPYKNMGKWIKDMENHVRSRNHQTKKLYFYYTTCPKCAKAHGKNHVVLLAQIDS